MTVEEINLLCEALTMAASRHDSLAKAGHKVKYHKQRATEMRAFGTLLLAYTPAQDSRGRWLAAYPVTLGSRIQAASDILDRTVGGTRKRLSRAARR